MDLSSHNKNPESVFDGNAYKLEGSSDAPDSEALEAIPGHRA